MQEPRPPAAPVIAGGIAADEPVAAETGRAILAAGGSAADAIVAATFALAVTYPGAASLGGGGICLAHDAGKLETTAFEFLARAARPAGGAAVAAVPGMARGMAALHARFGLRDWASLLLPAERLARDGYQVSRALASELSATPALLADPAARRLFAGADGRPIGEGERLRQPELAATIRALRSGRGASDLYSGATAARLLEDSAAAGRPLAAEELRGYSVVARPAEQRPYGVHSLAFTGASPQGGVRAAELTLLLAQELSWAGAGEAAQAHMFAEAAALVAEGVAAPGEDRLPRLARAFDRARHRPVAASGRVVEQPSATGLVAVDYFGQAVACAFTLNAPFGSAKLGARTGILLAAAPEPDGRSVDALGALMLVNRNTGNVFFGAAAAGGSAAPAAIARVALETLEAKRSLKDALAAPRILPAGASDTLWVEPELAPATRAGLAARGHRLAEAGALGHAVAFYCPEGVPRQPRCEVEADPRWFGLALTVVD